MKRTRVVLVALLALVFPGLSQTADARSKKPGTDIIGGGEVTDPARYPFMAAILDDSIEGDDEDKVFCGGSLIAPQWVLTAAHCFLGKEDVAVVVGRPDLSKEGEGHRSDVHEDEIYIHPDFESPVRNANDVALLKLEEPAIGFPTITLATNDAFEDPGDPLTTTGWGTTSTKKAVFPEILHEVTVPVVGDGPCKRVYRGQLDAATMVCAGAPGLDSCIGDSGGPLFATTMQNVSWIQVGITSWGRGCGKEKFPGVYTEVNSPGIRSWINETIAAN